MTLSSEHQSVPLLLSVNCLAYIIFCCFSLFQIADNNSRFISCFWSRLQLKVEISLLLLTLANILYCFPTTSLTADKIEARGGNGLELPSRRMSQTLRPHRQNGWKEVAKQDIFIADGGSLHRGILLNSD